MGILEMFEETSVKGKLENETHFRELLNTFFRKYGRFTLSSEIKNASYAHQFYSLKNFLQGNYPVYYYSLFEEMDSHGYNMRFELIDAAKVIGRKENRILKSQLFDYLKRSPIISEITKDATSFHVQSNCFNEIIFESIFDYLRKYPQALYWIENYIIEQYCHNISWELAKSLDNANLITALIPSYFTKEYYHSYVEHEGHIIDAANNTVYDRDVYEYLFQPKELSNTPGDIIEEKYREVISSDLFNSLRDKNLPQALVLGLKGQYEVRR